MALLKKIDQGRSLSLRAPQGCLRSLVRPSTNSKSSSRTIPNLLPNDLDRQIDLGTKQGHLAHTLAVPTIHLSKSNFTCKLRWQLSLPSSWPPVSVRFTVRGGGKSYRLFCPCQPLCRTKFFGRTSAFDHRPKQRERKALIDQLGRSTSIIRQPSSRQGASRKMPIAVEIVAERNRQQRSPNLAVVQSPQPTLAGVGDQPK